MKLIDLAASIRRDSLSNPVSLVRHPDHYEIETGERRWLAYHVLYWKFGDGDKRPDGSVVNWSRIPARIVTQVDVWRQASENNARDNLNAISRARQLSLLLMDLHGSHNFTALDASQSEQAFYAQVADGADWRIPRGQGERLLNAMGMSDAGQLRQYRALLRLPTDLWRKGDDEDLSEGELRRMKAALDSVTRVTVRASKSKKDALSRLAADATHWRNRMRKEINSVEPSTRPKLRKLIEAEIRQLLRLMADIDESDTSLIPNPDEPIAYKKEAHLPMCLSCSLPRPTVTGVTLHMHELPNAITAWQAYENACASRSTLCRTFPARKA